MSRTIAKIIWSGGFRRGQLRGAWGKNGASASKVIREERAHRRGDELKKKTIEDAHVGVLTVWYCGGRAGQLRSADGS